jgi:hypothetical protein
VSAEERIRVEETLRRIDDLVTGLSHVEDPVARDAARELVEAILDMQGLALARIMVALAAAEGGRAIMERLAQDEQVKSALLLYGLHPDDPQTRIRQAIAALGPRLGALGVAVELGRVTANTASIRVIGDAGQSEPLRREIEEAIVNAAPDLDEVAIEWLEPQDAVEAAALAG